PAAARDGQRPRQAAGGAQEALNPDGQCRAAKRLAPQKTQPALSARLTSTVAAYACWKDALLDLCRNIPCASRAPGQPPSSESRCSVLSRVRGVLLCAAALSAM